MDQYFNFLLLIFNSYYLNGYRRPLQRLIIANVSHLKVTIFYPQVPALGAYFDPSLAVQCSMRDICGKLGPKFNDH